MTMNLNYVVSLTYLISLFLSNRSLYGEKAKKLSERTNEATGLYAKQCIDLSQELGLPYINLWSKMQETGLAEEIPKVCFH